MQKVILRASRRVYIVFGIMFGGLGLFAFLLLSFKQCIASGLLLSSPFFIMLLLTYAMLFVYKITYNNKQIIYRGLFGTKTIDIEEIKNYKIKVALDTISTKPIFGLFKITINDPRRPTFGLVIDTIDKKSDMVIPIRLFRKKDIDNLVKHIESISEND